MMNFIEKWKNKIAQHVETRVDLFKLDFIERTSGILSYFIFIIICLLLALCILLFLGIGLGEFFTELVQSRTYGFFITAGIYTLLFVFLALARKLIVRLFIGMFINIMTHDDDDDEEEENSNKKHHH